MKKNLFVTVSFLFVLFFACSSTNGEKYVRKSYADFQEALKSKNGSEAAQLVAKNIFSFYDDVKKLALKSENVDLEKKSPNKVFMVIQYRYLLTQKELEQMNGRDLLVWNVNRGMVLRNMIGSISLGKIQIKNDKAFAQILLNDKPVDETTFDFWKEDGIWKFDLAKTLTMPGKKMDQAIAHAGKTKVGLALEMLAALYHTKIPEEILNGPLR